LRVLATGPSCSGKTALGRACRGCRLVELDLSPTVEPWIPAAPESVLAPEPAPAPAPGRVLFEGIPSGSDAVMAAFIASMDRIVLLDPPFDVRLERMIRRDGPAALGRFLYNEFAWHRYVLPLLADHRELWRVQGSEAGIDPFSDSPPAGS